MRVAAILSVSLLSFAVAPAADANRLPCIGSNEVRGLADNLASSDQLSVASLPTILAEIAAKTGAQMAFLQVLANGAIESHNEYRLFDRNNRYVITVTEISSTKVKLMVERPCQSETADGWQTGWQTALAELKRHGFSFEQQNF